MDGTGSHGVKPGHGSSHGQVSVVMAERCHYCSEFRRPDELIRIGTGGAVMCWKCYEWHQRALRMFAGDPPPGCQVCGITFQQLSENAPGGDIRMYVHPKDGVYQVLCKQCSDAYTRKRVDLYGDTVFGELMKLKGAK